MKKLLYLISIVIVTFNAQAQEQLYHEEIKKYQDELNAFYSDKETSPLSEKDLKSFTSLDFFPIDKKYKVEATFIYTPNEPIFEMLTTTDRLAKYRKYGIAKFTIDGKELTLSLYRNQKYLEHPEYGKLLFLPFKDLTNSTSSYGGGRFIDIEIPDKYSNTIIIDFNKAYNPYCAYNKKYSCPIPPFENHLEVNINAGVAYKKHH
jgi:uncharacterized protein (DUF1684 family)